MNIGKSLRFEVDIFCLYFHLLAKIQVRVTIQSYSLNIKDLCPIKQPETHRSVGLKKNKTKSPNPTGRLTGLPPKSHPLPATSESPPHKSFPLHFNTIKPKADSRRPTSLSALKKIPPSLTSHRPADRIPTQISSPASNFRQPALQYLTLVYIKPKADSRGIRTAPML